MVETLRVKRVGNYKARRKPIATPSSIVRQMFEVTEAMGLVNAEIDDAKNVSCWRTGRATPGLLRIEQILDRHGFEVKVVRKSDDKR